MTLLPVIHTVQIGGLWEGPTWELHLNEEIDGYYQAGAICPHCLPTTMKSHVDYRGVEYARAQMYVCPRVVVAFNEGGYATTGVCLDCILDAVRALGV